MANFAPQVGYEIKGVHFAIVVTKNDQPFIGTITVIPLTSKQGNHLLPLGDWLGDSILSELKNNEKSKRIKEDNALMERVVLKYKNIQNSSFANVYQITTIDKSRILMPLNKFDPIQKLKVGNDILNRLDAEIIRLFTK